MQIQTSPSTLDLVLTIESLLKELEDLYPQYTPNPETTLAQIMYRAGQRSVIEWIEERVSSNK